jgi:hypothetical protein
VSPADTPDPAPDPQAAYVDNVQNPKGTPDHWLAPPKITSPTSYTVPENQTAVATLAASSEQPVTFTKAGGADTLKFALTTAGVLTFLAAPDFETPTDANTDNTYVVDVTATNSHGSDTKTISVKVTDLAGATLGSARHEAT